jgi:hypothetical protein
MPSFFDMIASRFPKAPPKPSSNPFEPNAEFVASLPEANPFGLFGPSSSRQYIPGASSSATWNPNYSPTFGNAPPSILAAMPPGSPPMPQESAPDPSAQAASSSEPVTTGPPKPFDTFYDASLANYQKASAALPPPPGMGGYDRSKTKAGLDNLMAAGRDWGAAQRAEATVVAEGDKQLAALEGDRANLYEKAGDEDLSTYDRTVTEYATEKKKHEEDVQWLRDNPKIDPYRTFTTNAGAGILALLGVGLMAGGAGLRRDSSLDWTKQIDKMLDREADAQMRLVKNKQFAATESGQNMQRILSSSKDFFEAKTRFRNQYLSGLNAKAEAIKQGTESKAVVERAEALIAKNNESIAKGLADIGIRQEGLSSQEVQSRLQSAVGLRDQEVRLLLGLTGTEAEREKALNNILYQRSKPVIDTVAQIEKDYAVAASAGKALREALLKGEKGPALNNLASPFAQAVAQFMGGGAGSQAGIRDEVRAYGIPTSFEQIMAKLQAMDANDVANLMQHLAEARDDKKVFLYERHAQGFNPPPNAQYSAPPPARGAPRAAPRAAAPPAKK